MDSVVIHYCNETLWSMNNKYCYCYDYFYLQLDMCDVYRCACGHKDLSVDILSV